MAAVPLAVEQEDVAAEHPHPLPHLAVAEDVPAAHLHLLPPRRQAAAAAQSTVRARPGA